MLPSGSWSRSRYLDRQMFSHRHQPKCQTFADFQLDAVAPFIAARPVEFDSRQCRHQLQRLKASGFGFGFTDIQNRPRNSLPRMLRMNEEGANPGGFGFGIEFGCVTSLILVAAKQRPSLTPTAAANQLAIIIGDEISPIENQIRIDAKNRFDGAFDLLFGIVGAAQATRGGNDELLDGEAISERGFAD